MNPSTGQDIRSEKEIFFAALDHPTAEARAIFLDGACGKNPALRQRVEKLLANHFEADSFMQAAAVDAPAEMFESPVVEEPGTQIGRYKILQRLGEGGFGIVYMAEQKEPVKRRVALKIIKLGMDTEQVVARFEAERQALAMMDHPNIAKVHDGGATKTGRPYFVMELVKGIPITKYCDDNKLTTKERLELFIPICQAIQHAHQKGIIHRDIKPNNVMITLHDGKPVPKVIDFGIAKATQQELTEKTIFTQYSQFIGTPAYMSPEQAEMSGLDIDTRTDIYSLGVLLYELLVGQTPLDAKELMTGGYDEIRRRIKEQEPSKPSTKVSTFEGSERTSVAKQRKISPKQLSSQLQGDLDWIVLKALEKDRMRRYETANGFALDIQRFLRDEPVSAVAPSVLYRFRKFARRNKIVFGAATAIALSLLVGLGAAWVSYSRERVARADAEVRRSQAEEAQQIAEKSKEDALQATRIAEGLKDDFRKQVYQADMALASQAYQSGDIGQMNHLIAKHWPLPVEKDLRGFEWYHWWQAGRLDVETGWFGPFREFEISPSRATYAVVAWPYWVFVNKSWPAKGAYPGQTNVAKIRTNSEWCTIAYTPDGTALLVGNPHHGRIQVHETETWTSQPIDAPGDGGIHSFAWSPTQPIMATGGSGGRVVLWDVTIWEPLGAPMEATGSIWDLNFTRDGESLLAAMEDSTVAVWDVATRSIRKTMTAHGERVKRVVASPTSDFFATGSSDQTVRLWNKDYELADTFDLSGRVEDLRFSKDGNRLLAATSGNNSVFVLEVKTQPLALELVHEIKGHSASVLAADFAPEENMIISVSEDASSKKWDLNRCEPFVTLNPIPEAVQVEFSPDGKELLILDQEGTRHQWDIEPQRKSAPVPQPQDFRLLALSANGLFQAGLTPNGCVEVRDALEKTNWISPQPAYKVGKLIIVSANGDTVAWNSPDGVRIWKRGNSQAMHIKTRVDISPVLSANGERLAVRDLDTTRVFDLTGEFPNLVCRVKGNGPELCATFSPDGKTLAVGTWKNNSIRLHDAETGDLKDTLMGHRDMVYQLAFSRDGSRLVSCGEDEVLRIWAPETGRMLSALKILPSRAISLTWSSDDRSLAELNSEGIVRIWSSPADVDVK